MTSFPAQAFGSISLDLNETDLISIKARLTNHDEEISQTFAYIVQVENDLGYAIALSFKEGTLAPGGVQDITMNWTTEDEGTIAIKTFVWSGFDSPIHLQFLSERLVITANG